ALPSLVSSQRVPVITMTTTRVRAPPERNARAAHRSASPAATTAASPRLRLVRGILVLSRLSTMRENAHLYIISHFVLFYNYFRSTVHLPCIFMRVPNHKKRHDAAGQRQPCAN